MDNQKINALEPDIWNLMFPRSKRVENLLTTARKFQIKNVPEFVGQIFVESAGLTVFSENLNYSQEALKTLWPNRPEAWTFGRTASKPADQQAIANSVYGSRMGNKDAGDGWRYRGRGALQITGRDAYTSFGHADNPDTLADDPQVSCDVAGWFWTVYKPALNGEADVAVVTRLVTGSSSHMLAERQDATRRFYQLLGGG